MKHKEQKALIDVYEGVSLHGPSTSDSRGMTSMGVYGTATNKDIVSLWLVHLLSVLNLLIAGHKGVRGVVTSPQMRSSTSKGTSPIT